MAKEYIRKESLVVPSIPLSSTSNVLEGSREGLTEHIYSVDDFVDVKHLEAYVDTWGEDHDYHNILMPAIVSRREHINLPNGQTALASVVLSDTEMGRYCRQWVESNTKESNPVIESYCLRGGGEECDCLLRDSNAYYWHMSHARGMEDVQPHQWYKPCRDTENYVTTWRTRIQAGKAGKIPPKVQKAVSRAANELANVSNDPTQTKIDLELLSAAPLKWHPLSMRKKRHIVHNIKQHPFAPTSTRYSQRKLAMSDLNDAELTETEENPSYTYNAQYEHNGMGGGFWFTIVFVVVIILLILGGIWLLRATIAAPISSCADGKCGLPNRQKGLPEVSGRDTYISV